MRLAIWGALVAAATMSHPAWAMSDSLLALDVPIQSGVDNLITTGASLGVGILPTLRARLDLGDVLPGRTVDTDAPRVRRRFASSMIDYYPFGEGFHVSAGGRLDNRQRAARSGMSFGNGLLYAPRSQFDAGRGFKRLATALTMGYGRTLLRGLTLGIEGGVLMERGKPSARELIRFVGMGSHDSRYAATNVYKNPIVQISLGYKF